MNLISAICQYATTYDVKINVNNAKKLPINKVFFLPK